VGLLGGSQAAVILLSEAYLSLVAAGVILASSQAHSALEVVISLDIVILFAIVIPLAELRERNAYRRMIEYEALHLQQALQDPGKRRLLDSLAEELTNSRTSPTRRRTLIAGARSLLDEWAFRLVLRALNGYASQVEEVNASFQVKLYLSRLPVWNNQRARAIPISA
jgi:hypothetical protein